MRSLGSRLVHVADRVDGTIKRVASTILFDEEGMDSAVKVRSSLVHGIWESLLYLDHHSVKVFFFHARWHGRMHAPVIKEEASPLFRVFPASSTLIVPSPFSQMMTAVEPVLRQSRGCSGSAEGTFRSI